MFNERRLMLGNEAIARGLVENGCTLAASYPGTPASEILSSLVTSKRENSLSLQKIVWPANLKETSFVLPRLVRTGP